MTAGVEVEVKLSVGDPDVIRRLLEEANPEDLAGFWGTDRVTEQVVVDRYIDTADARLAADGARARVRVPTSGVPVLALKRHGVADGALTARHEVEGPATESLDPDEWPDSVAKRELLELTEGLPVVEIARLRQRRHVRILRRGRVDVELSLDELEALDGDRVAASRWELEAELKAGDRQPLHELAEALGRLPGIGPAVGSKLAFARTARSG